MPNPVKYSTSSIDNSTLVGSVAFGWVGSDYGPSETSNWFAGIDPPTGGYTIYYTSASQITSIVTANNDAQLLYWVNSVATSSFTSASTAITWLNTNGYAVANQVYSSVVSNGLVLYLDALNPSSYPGSGSTWYDLSGNSNNVAMQNQGSISWNAGGYFNTGVNGWFNKASGSNIPTGSSLYTLSAWVKLSSTWSGNGIMSIGTFGVTNQSNALRTAGTNVLLNYWWANDYSVSSTVSPTDAWFNVVARDNGTNRTIWVNGVAVGTPGSNSGHNVVSSTIQIGKTAGSELLNGNIAQALIYNRSLSDLEVVNNFNASKTRFGL